ncbi:response regulator transcription factor [Rubinisphaera margarita]|uniref:response regulator transcription factor n=1 Tax=Rubinisphaera margarita TaxID=2909586 RepID=UPI001EE858FA|nr:response regulator transcription factor [Rubinisphaera margarita]MCG6156523.1 response regulator transcription factor [Rubinisphaera margarita]
MSGHPQKIAIIDDHPAVRDGLATRISLEDDLTVCGEAEDVADGLELIRRTGPQVAVVDISLKSGNGLDLIRQARAENEFVRFLVWSMYDEDLYADRALRAGAMGYINKQAATDSIVTAIRSVLDNKIYLSSEMSSTLLHRLVMGQSGLQNQPEDALSDRELQVYEQIGLGRTTVEIAEALTLSSSTIETYRARIKQKLDCHSMADLARRASQWVLERG